MKVSKKDGIFKGALILGVCAFFAKVLGAFYRVPLTNLLGGYGLGLYQMIFPIYSLLLDFSSGGAPTALAKIISSENNDRETSAHNYLVSSIKFLSLIGVGLTLVLVLFCKPISTLQGNSNSYLGYLFLSPSILLVCAISCFRGYFQGLMDMKPTAISQIIEQLVKLALGLAFVYLLSANTVYAVAGATFAITLSELVALFYLVVVYKKRKVKLNLNLLYQKQGNGERIKRLLKYSFPIIVVGTLIPLSHVVDSFMIVNVLSKYRQDATTLFGLLSGVALTVINLPVSICHGVSTVAVPSISSTHSKEEKNRRAEKTLLLTLLVTIPCAILCFLFAPFIVSLLFRSLGTYEKDVAINLIKITSPCIILLSLIQTQNAILVAKNKLYLPSINLFIGVVLKIVVNLILLPIPKFNVYGGAFGLIACYFFTCLVNLITLISLKVKDERSILASRQNPT